MMKLLNKWDISVIVLTLICALGIYVAVGSMSLNKGPVAEIYHDSELVATLNLSEDTIYVLEQRKYPQLYGDFEIEVKDGKVHILKEVCPQGICVDLGWTDTSSKALICLPNKIFVKVVEDDSGSDVMNQ